MLFPHSHSCFIICSPGIQRNLRRPNDDADSTKSWLNIWELSLSKLKLESSVMSVSTREMWEDSSPSKSTWSDFRKLSLCFSDEAIPKFRGKDRRITFTEQSFHAYTVKSLWHCSLSWRKEPSQSVCSSLFPICVRRQNEEVVVCAGEVGSETRGCVTVLIHSGKYLSPAIWQTEMANLSLCHQKECLRSVNKPESF